MMIGAKKEAELPNVESAGDSLIRDCSTSSTHNSIETSPIMISTETTLKVKNSGRRGTWKGVQLSQEDVVRQMEALQMDETPINVYSTSQRRRASVDESAFTASTNNLNSIQPFNGTDKRVTLYKTEMCRTFEETGICKYGIKCQFAHDRSEIRNIPRHPRYKTEICKTFWEQGNCPYGKRCCFIHTENEVRKVPEISLATKKSSTAPSAQPNSPEKCHSRILNRLHRSESIPSSSLPIPGIFNIELSAASRASTSNWLSHSSFKEDSFFEFGSKGPIGSPTFAFDLGLTRGSNLPVEPLFESVSHATSDSSETFWEEESHGLLPCDLMNQV